MGEYSLQFVKKASLSTREGVLSANICTFLAKHDLLPETDADFTVNLLNYNDEIVATGSLVGNVLKYIAVSPDEQGTGACASVVSELVSYAAREGIFKLFLFTKPKNEQLFRSLGFYTLAKTDSAMMMENDRFGLSKFIERVKSESPTIPDGSVIGSVVANCNPMTNGHLYLFEQAAKNCDYFHVFILSEDKSMFPANDRYDIVKAATAHIPNLILHRSSDYIISAATFPTYFIKDKAAAENINADLDITLFCTRIAPELGISSRFVGTEPYCAVTNTYNDRMHALLPKHDMRLIEFERKDGISASTVRKLIAEKNFDELKKIVPTVTFQYIVTHFN